MALGQNAPKGVENMQGIKCGIEMESSDWGDNNIVNAVYIVILCRASLNMCYHSSYH